jgi:arylsulfatase A-like enzyme
LIVLSADHGASEAPEHAQEMRIETGRLPFDYFKKGEDPVSLAVAKRFGRKLISDHSHPYLLGGRLVEAPFQQRIRRNFSPDRSGNVHLVPDPYWFLHSTDEADKMGLPAVTAIHGSPRADDTYVPIFFAGGRLEAQSVSRRVASTDIAPTIAAYLGIKYPSGSVGTPLAEVLGGSD